MKELEGYNEVLYGLLARLLAAHESKHLSKTF